MRAPTGPTSGTFFSQRLRLHYVDWGNPSAPPMIMIHGGRDHCRNWDFAAEHLRDRFHIVAPDLRGHGDSQWSVNGGYSMAAHIYDLAQLIERQKCAPVTIVAHSLGGMIALRYAGLYPDKVARVVSIEGLGSSPKQQAEKAAIPYAERLANWVGEQRQLAARQPRRYASLDEAVARMQAENKHLTPAQALHLTRFGVNQNEDGSYSWKFDNYLRSWPPSDMTQAEVEHLWGRITCPTLLVYGGESTASNPDADGRARHFKTARVVTIPGASHWVHHDQFDAFMRELDAFLGAPAPRFTAL
jgi:pimeloyl-ACP methyl ester carboxylesterase